MEAFGRGGRYATNGRESSNLELKTERLLRQGYWYQTSRRIVTKQGY
jgi:hypothetical protein